MQTEVIVFSHIGLGYAEGLLLIKSNNKYGFIDTSGKVVIPFIYEKASSFSEGIAAVALNGKYGYINKLNEVVIPFKYNNAKSFSEGLAPVMFHNTWRYINHKGEEVIKLNVTFGEADPFSEGLAIVYNRNNKSGYINKCGNLVIPDIYEYAEHFNEGIALVESGLNIGYINSKGAYVIPCIHYNGLNCCNGMVSVYKQDNTWTVFAKDGKEVEHFGNYEFVDTFKDGYALVKSQSKYGICDIKGNLIIPCVYDYPIVHRSNLFCVYSNHKWGAVDKQNKIVIPFEYEKLQPLNESRFLARKSTRENLIIDHNNSVICTLSSRKTKRFFRIFDSALKLWAVILGLLAFIYVVSLFVYTIL